MANCLICNVCDTPGSFDEAAQVEVVRCNVRAFETDLFTVWRCPNCYSLHCKEDADLPRYYSRYPVQQHELDLWARVAYRNYLSRLRRAGLLPGARVLDFGCGPGLLVKFLRENGYQAQGYDAYAQNFADASVLDYQYDFVVAQDVLEHAEEPRELLKTLRSRVKVGGVLCIGTPDAAGIDLSDAQTYSLSLHQPYHRHILSEQALLALGHECDLAPLQIYHRFYYDTLVPTVNYRFLRSYVRRAGNLLDAAFEPPRLGMVMTSPQLIFEALFGYLFSPRSEMMVIFRRN